jgi:hypothetical protein
VAFCSPVEVDRRFRGAYYLHHQGDKWSLWLFSDDGVRTSETSVYLYETKRRYIPKSYYLHTRHRENMKSHMYTYVLLCKVPGRSQKYYLVCANTKLTVWGMTSVPPTLMKNSSIYYEVGLFCLRKQSKVNKKICCRFSLKTRGLIVEWKRIKQQDPQRVTRQAGFGCEDTRLPSTQNLEQHLTASQDLLSTHLLHPAFSTVDKAL